MMLFIYLYFLVAAIWFAIEGSNLSAEGFLNAAFWPLVCFKFIIHWFFQYFKNFLKND